MSSASGQINVNPLPPSPAGDPAIGDAESGGGNSGSGGVSGPQGSGTSGGRNLQLTEALDYIHKHGEWRVLDNGLNLPLGLER